MMVVPLAGSPHHHICSAHGRILRVVHRVVVYRLNSNHCGFLRLPWKHDFSARVARDAAAWRRPDGEQGGNRHLIGYVLGHLIGVLPISGGWLAGISTLAVVAAFNDTNGGLYVALMEHYGRPEDAGAYCVMALEAGPFFTMITLGVAGLSSFPWQTLVGAILPLFVGIALGNLDQELKIFLGKAAPALIPFFAFGLGASLNLKRIWEAGLIGFMLGILVIVISGLSLIIADRLTGGTGVAGVAAATTAGNAAAVPALVAAADHRYAAAAGPATVLVASCVIVTAFLVPPLVAWWDRRTRPSRTNALETRSVDGPDADPRG